MPNHVKKLSSVDSYAIYYHLAKEREFIIEPMGLSKNDLVLEIGSGCGAISGALTSSMNRFN